MKVIALFFLRQPLLQNDQDYLGSILTFCGLVALPGWVSLCLLLNLVEYASGELPEAVPFPFHESVLLLHRNRDWLVAEIVALSLVRF